MAANAHLKNEFTEDKKYHNLTSWLILVSRRGIICTCKICYPYVWQLSRDMTKPTMWLCAQRTLRSACVSEVSSCGERRLWSDWVDAQAGLSLRWAHRSLHQKGAKMKKINKWSWYNIQKWFGKMRWQFTDSIQASHIELFSICLEFFFIYTFYN